MIPITLYGTADCEDTERTRAHLQRLDLPFREVEIAGSPEAEAFVRFINDGYRSTPTVVIGARGLRLVLTEPSDPLLEEALARFRDLVERTQPT